MRCQSVMQPLTAEYWHIGAMTIRLANSKAPTQSGVNSALMPASPYSFDDPTHSRLDPETQADSSHPTYRCLIYAPTRIVKMKRPVLALAREARRRVRCELDGNIVKVGRIKPVPIIIVCHNRRRRRHY